MKTQWLGLVFAASLATALAGCKKEDAGSGPATPAKSGETKFGLTEDQRKEVWRDLFRGERLAAQDAEQKSPVDGAVTQAAKDLNAQLRLKFKDERWAKVATERKLTRAQLDQIYAEGTQKSW